MSYNKGKNNPMYGVCRKGHGLGRKLSVETKRKMSEKAKLRMGENTSNWKGGQKTDGNGYVYILMPNHPRANKAGYVHRSYLVIEKVLGRYLYHDEITHHKNGIVYDDSPENIEVTTQSKHTTFHNRNREENRKRNILGNIFRRKLLVI